MKHRLITVICFFMISLNTNAQYSISGTILSEEEFPIQYVNVRIINAEDSTFILGQSFEGTKLYVPNITKSNIIINISSIGFKDFKKKLNLKTSHLDLGDINLETISLGEVVVTANRPLIKQTTEGLIFDVANSYYSKEFDGIELLSHTPNLQVTDNGINIVGRSGVLVLINGKQTYMDGRQLIEFIRTIGSRNVSKIVVSSNPSAKYDAQGNSGVINIILKRDDGFNLDLSLTYIKAKENTFSPSGGFSYSNDRLYTSLNSSSFWENKVYESETEYLYKDHYRKTMTDRVEKSNPDFNSNFAIDYKLTNRSNIGLLSSINIKRGTVEYSSNSYDSDYHSIQKTRRMPSLSDESNNYFSIYPYWDFKIDSLGTKLQVEGGYVKSKSDKDIDLSEYLYDNNPESYMDSIFSTNNSNLEYDLYTIKGDFILPLKKYGTFEVGTKSLFIRNTSDRQAYGSDKNFETIIDEQKDRFKMDEDIYSVYASHSVNLSERLSSRIGIRYEHTTNKTNLLTENSYGHFFPSISFSYKINERIYTNIGYNKRFNRPGISQINPFRWYTNSMEYTTGNTGLKPEIMHNIDLGLSRGPMSINLYGTFLKDGIQYINEEDNETGGYSNYPINTLRESKIGCTFNYYWMPFNKLSMFSSLNVFLYELKSNFSKYEVSSTDGHGGSVMISPSYSINRKWGNGIDLMLMYSLPQSNKIKSNSSYFFWGIRYKHSFLNDNLKFAFTISDPWRWAKNKNKNIYTDFTFKSKLYNDSRSFKFTLSYNFSNSKLRKVNRQIDKSGENRIK